MAELEPSHPRHETEEERSNAHTALQKLVKRRVTRYGGYLLGRQVLRLDNSAGSVVLSRFFEGPSLTIVITRPVDEISESKVFYESIDNGPFLRTDLVSDKLEPSITHEELCDYSVRSAKRRIANQEAGLDGFPITALEANEVAELIEGSTVAVSHLSLPSASDEGSGMQI